MSQYSAWQDTRLKSQKKFRDLEVKKLSQESIEWVRTKSTSVLFHLRPNPAPLKLPSYNLRQERDIRAVINGQVLCLGSKLMFPLRGLGPTLVEKWQTLWQTPQTIFTNKFQFSQSTTRCLKLYVPAAHFLLTQGNNLRRPKTLLLNLLPSTLLTAKIPGRQSLKGMSTWATHH